MTEKSQANESRKSGRGQGRTLEGLVSSNSMEKTAVIKVMVRKRHAQYGKYVQRTMKYYAHDERNECNVGDRVRIVESRPMSKLKRWRLVNILERAIAE